MKKFLIAILMATVAGALTFGAAASLSLSSEDLGQGSAPVEACDTDGINIGWNGNGVMVTEAILSNVADRCDGQFLAINIYETDGTLTQVFTTVPVAPSVFGFTVDINTATTYGGAPVPATENIDSVTLAINGPVL